MQSSTAALLTAIVVGIVLFALGYGWRSFKSAQGNYRLAKSTVPKMRTGYFSAVWSLVKTGAIVLVLVALLVSWTVNDQDDSAESPAPAPSPSATR